jgi:WD40 repeat protein
MSDVPPSRTRVFISYSHRDKDYLDELLEQLGTLVRRGQLDLWVDTQIEDGDLWRDEIRQGLESARVAILLVSPAFLNSKFITEEEVPHLLRAARREQVRILPIILKPCLYDETELKDYQAVNSQSRPLSGMDETQRGMLWVSVAKQVKATLEAHPPTPVQAVQANRPRDYVPITPNPLFQPRPGEFEALEALLTPAAQPLRLGLVGVVGMGGVGKTQLAVELAFRYQERFPDGRFWMPAIGTLSDWQRQLADLAERTGYLPPDDVPGQPDTELRRARHFTAYLATHAGALLVLDNIEHPDLIVSALPALAGGPLACIILYTSRVRVAPEGVRTHPVESLDMPEALRLLLVETRPTVLAEAQADNESAEVLAARQVCRAVGFLPLGLVHLRRLLARTPTLTLARLAEGLRQRGALEIAKYPYPDVQSLFATFLLSWEQVQDERARQVLYLAGFFPEAAPMPLWLLGLAADLGERSDPWEPLGEACQELYELSLLELLQEGQARLHPLVREFAQRLVVSLPDQGQELTQQAGARLVAGFWHLGRLEQRARREGYWACLEQTRAAASLAELLDADQEGHLERLEDWLGRESHLLAAETLWPEPVPGLFYQQLANRAVEETEPLSEGEAPAPWLRQLAPVGAEDRALLRILRGHQSEVWSVAFSLNGKRVLTGSADGTARIWLVETGQEERRLVGHQSRVSSVAFSPDGKWALTGSYDGTARIWLVETGQEERRLVGHQRMVESVAFSSDGKWALTGSDDWTARIWLVKTGQEERRLVGHQRSVSSVTFSPDGKRALTGSEDGTARVWLVATGQEEQRLEGHQGWVNSVAFSPDGKWALTGSYDGTARVWLVKTGQEERRLVGHQRSVRSVAFSSDGKWALTGSKDKTARVWLVATGQEEQRLVGHQDEVSSVTFSPDGKRVLTGSEDGTARVWSAETGQEEQRLVGHQDEVSSVAFSPDGKWVLTGSEDKTARVWLLATGQEERRLEGRQSRVNSVAFSPDGKRALTGSDDWTARVWLVATGQEEQRLVGHQGWVNSVVFSPDGKRVLTGSQDKTAQVWSAETGQEERLL